MKNAQIPKRPYRDDIQLSILGLGGMLLVNMEQSTVDKIVSEALRAGHQLF